MSAPDGLLAARDRLTQVFGPYYGASRPSGPPPRTTAWREYPAGQCAAMAAGGTRRCRNGARPGEATCTYHEAATETASAAATITPGGTHE